MAASVASECALLTPGEALLQRLDGGRMSAEINVPTELQPVLRDYTKAVLRNFPEDVIEFSRQYFLAKSSEHRMNSYTLPPSTSKTFSELEADDQAGIENIFKRHDVDMDGNLDLDELRAMMEELGGVFGFEGPLESEMLFALLDSDGNQQISWQEWSHACAVWLQDTRGS